MFEDLINTLGFNTKYYVLSMVKLLHNNPESYFDYVDFSEIIKTEIQGSQCYFNNVFQDQIENTYIMSESDFDKLIDLIKSKTPIKKTNSLIKSSFRLNSYFELPIRLQMLDKILLTNQLVSSGLQTYNNQSSFIKESIDSFQNSLLYYSDVLKSPDLSIECDFHDGCELVNLNLEPLILNLSKIKNNKCFEGKTYKDIYFEVVSKTQIINNIYPIIKEDELIM